jgi:hypothetical protein
MEEAASFSTKDWGDNFLTWSMGIGAKYAVMGLGRKRP